MHYQKDNINNINNQLFIYSAEDLYNMYNEILSYVENYVEPLERKNKLKILYQNMKENIIFSPASSRIDYHNCYIGGYMEHILNVVKISLALDDIYWKYINNNTEKNENNERNYSINELVFAALNHDLYKIGDSPGNFYYIQNTDMYKISRGEIYYINPNLKILNKADMSLFLLNKNGIEVTYNEFLAIKTHDGLFDDANKKYFIDYFSKIDVDMHIILHQADVLSTRAEKRKINKLLKTKNEK